MKKTKCTFIVIDGIDKIGKDTQINQLKNYFSSQNKTYLSIDCIGGSQHKDFIHLKVLRELIFNAKELSPELEEKTFALASFLNLQIVQKLKEINKYEYILQNRGSLSHIAYGLTKNHSRKHLNIYYKQVNNILSTFKTNYINICLLPKNFELFIKQRIDFAKNKHKEISARHEKLENIDFQKKVYYNMLNEFELAKMNKSSFLQKDSCKMLLIEETSSIEDVKKQLISIIEKE